MSEHLHAELASGRWEQMPLPEQMGNIGSEVSRALRELSRLREIMCDFFLGENEYQSDDAALQ